MKIAGINFDHMHMGDLLRMVHEHPYAEIVGISDEQPDRMREVIANFGIPADRVFTDYKSCLEQTRPDLVILCPATADHAAWTEKVAPFGTHILMEKPFAANLADADRMIAAMTATGKELIINWPLRWYPSHVTAKRLIDEGNIGEVIEVHYYDGNRGPLWHGADKIETTPTAEAKAASWFYKKSAGGGSLLDYLGYGTTLGTWFMDGKAPIEVTALTHNPDGLEVDEHAIVIARYATGLSKFETRWGTFSDPWTHQPQPKCGFVIVGTQGTISSYDLEPTIRLQTAACPQGEDIPSDTLTHPHHNPVAYVIDRLEKHLFIDGPLSPAIARIGQQIVDSAVLSVEKGGVVALVK
ncbi:MAG: Gfo/Idh/MocA family protein [Luteolibacter sp.]|jgi:predicted dehydrogenase